MNTLQAEQLRDIIQNIYEKTGAYPEVKTFEDSDLSLRILIQFHIKKGQKGER
jgi:hypothetical protein